MLSMCVYVCSRVDERVVHMWDTSNLTTCNVVKIANNPITKEGVKK